MAVALPLDSSACFNSRFVFARLLPCKIQEHLPALPRLRRAATLLRRRAAGPQPGKGRFVAREFCRTTSLLLLFHFRSVEVPAWWSPRSWRCNKFPEPELLRRGPLQGGWMMLWLCLRGRALSLPGNVNSPGCMLKLH